MIRIDAPQRSPEWFAARLGKATGSRFADVLATIKTGEAASRRNYRTMLALERITGQQAETFQTQAMLDGIERETMARRLYVGRTGNFVEEVGFCLHDTLEAGASPDGLVDEDGSIEIKSPTDGVFATYLRLAKEPPEYTAQIQGLLWITGRQWCDFVSFSPNFPENARLIVRRVNRDETYIAKLAVAVEVFMEEVRSEADYYRDYREPDLRDNLLAA